MKLQIYTILFLLTVSSLSPAAVKRPLEEVNTDEFTEDTQVSVQQAGDKHIAMVWWIPNEFWMSIFARDKTTSEADKKSMLDVVSGVSLLAVVQADISKIGAFAFYTKEEIQKSMTITFLDEGGRSSTLAPLESITPDLEVVLSVFKPILGAAMGNLGSNMHFYVLNDRDSSSIRLLDPYQKGQIDIQLKKRSNELMGARIEMPLNSLFVPRKCPNGKEAHITWKYCPWSGNRLKD